MNKMKTMQATKAGPKPKKIRRYTGQKKKGES